jgi:endonuclease/exonuclease/phosphatase family metal-dependent hydrolase
MTAHIAATGDASTESARRIFHGAHTDSAPTQPSPRRRRLKQLALVACVLGVFAVQGSSRAPLGPDAGVSLSAPTSRSDDGDETLKIGTFNIHGCRGTDGIQDVGRVAETLRGLDFAGLNEVHGGLPWRGQDQTAALGQDLGMAWLFAPTEERWWCDQFGNGALSNLPITSWQRIPLARRYGKSFRNAVLMRAEHRGRPVNLLVTHIDRSDDRERTEQLRTVGDLFLSLATPAVLLGDLNTDASEPALKRLLEADGVHDPLRDKLGDGAPRRIDWILVRGLETLDAGLVNNGASDHPHVWAELAWPNE